MPKQQLDGTEISARLERDTVYTRFFGYKADISDAERLSMGFRPTRRSWSRTMCNPPTAYRSLSARLCAGSEPGRAGMERLPSNLWTLRNRTPGCVRHQCSYTLDTILGGSRCVVLWSL